MKKKFEVLTTRYPASVSLNVNRRRALEKGISCVNQHCDLRDNCDRYIRLWNDMPFNGGDVSKCFLNVFGLDVRRYDEKI